MVPRRGIALAVLAFLAAGLGMLHPAEARAFSFDDVVRRAAHLGSSPYQKPSSNLPKDLKDLTYDQYRDIRFRPERALWRNTKLPFEIMFFHEGRYFDEPVKIHEVTADGVRDIGFDPALFDYGKNKLNPDQMRRLGFAGFRVHFPLNRATYRDEALVFLGASYFRALGRGQRYGVSARGLAIDTAASAGEEFPRFVEFWIERPQPVAKELAIYGLLDSPRAAGAYRFVLTPGTTTATDVEARLFLRENVGKLGLAPLTSMFFFGANQYPTRHDYRPEVHDSDGLSIHSASGEWLWRPLVNPKRLLVTSFALTDPRGFGLMQRERWFARYEDLEARYDLRPSAWVEPKGAWGPGKVELVQIPVPDETNDNIVAYWVPDQAPKPKEAYAYAYRILWQKDRETRPPVAWVHEVRRGRGYTASPDGSIELHLDFEGGKLAEQPPEAAVEAAIWMDANAEILEQHAHRNEVTHGWRATVRFRRLDSGKPVELRVSLHAGSQLLSETCSYIVPPD